MDITLAEFREFLNSGKEINAKSDILSCMSELAQDAMKITCELNNKYHTPDEIIEIFEELTGKSIDKSFRIFPPFYTDCGKNITIGKNVFINSSCHFQDQGGIIIDDGTFIGHCVTLTTLNHSSDPNNRGTIFPSSIKIGKNVWIGANATIVPGITIGDNAIIGAGSVVVKDIPANAVAVGNPCRVIKYIDNSETESFKNENIFLEQQRVLVS